MLSEQANDAVYEGWAVVELLGHRRLIGQAREIELFGSKVLRLDVALPGGRSWPHFVTTNALFALTPTTAAQITDAVRRENQRTLISFDLGPEGEREDYEAWSKEQEELRRRIWEEQRQRLLTAGDDAELDATEPW